MCVGGQAVCLLNSTFSKTSLSFEWVAVRFSVSTNRWRGFQGSRDVVCLFWSKATDYDRESLGLFIGNFKCSVCELFNEFFPMFFCGDFKPVNDCCADDNHTN